jgi:hypothetical protein
MHKSVALTATGAEQHHRKMLGGIRIHPSFVVYQCYRGEVKRVESSISVWFSSCGVWSSGTSLFHDDGEPYPICGQPSIELTAFLEPSSSNEDSRTTRHPGRVSGTFHTVTRFTQNGGVYFRLC